MTHFTLQLHRRLAVTAIATLLATSAMAQGVSLDTEEGAPATQTEGGGGSSVTGLDDTLSTDGNLDVYDRNGIVRGSGEAQFTLDSPGVTTIAGRGGVSIPVFALDPNGNGRIDAEEELAARQFSASRTEPCNGMMSNDVAMERIAAVSESTRITLMLVCATPDGLDPERRTAIAANSSLMNRLASAGYGLGSVAGLALDELGNGTLYLTAP